MTSKGPISGSVCLKFFQESSLAESALRTGPVAGTGRLAGRVLSAGTWVRGTWFRGARPFGWHLDSGARVRIRARASVRLAPGFRRGTWFRRGASVRLAPGFGGHLVSGAARCAGTWIRSPARSAGTCLAGLSRFSDILRIRGMAAAAGRREVLRFSGSSFLTLLGRLCVYSGMGNVTAAVQKDRRHRGGNRFE